MAKNWSIIVPEATINLCNNPSFETNTTGWAAGGSNTIARNTAVQFRGVYALKVTYQNSTTLVSFTVASGVLTTGQTYTITIKLYVPSDWNGGDIQIGASSFTGATVTQIREWDSATGDTGKWVELETQLVLSSDATGTITIVTTGAPTAGRFIYIDALQIENKSYATTYCDGNQPGCAWLGTAHGAQSERDQFEASGGRLMNLDDDLYFLTGLDEGTGVPPLEILTQTMSFLPGDYVQGIKVKSRTNLLLNGGFEGETTPDLHAKRQALIKALNSRVGQINKPPQPRQLRYHGSSVEKEIGVFYVNGLGVKDRMGTFGERINGLQFYAPDPFWYDTAEKAAVLNTLGTDTLRLVAGRIGGTWSAMGPPDVAGTYTGAYAIAEDDTYIYVGGDFLNFNNIAAADYIVRWHKVDQTWSALSALNGLVWRLTVDIDGSLIATGSFTNAGGVANADYIARWDGSSWSAIGAPNSGGAAITLIRDVKVSSSGNIYICGGFTDLAGVANADGIAYWDGAAWNALGTGLDGGGYALAIDRNEGVYVTGSFSNAGGSPAAKIAYWDGAAWNALGSGLNNTGSALLLANDGLLYVGGGFTTAGGNTANYIAVWNGAAFSSLGGGLGPGSSFVFQIVQSQVTGEIYVAGAFYQTGDGLDNITARAAIWNGSQWAYLDLNFPSSTHNIYAFHVRDNGDLFLGGDFVAKTANYAASTTISYEGSDYAYPTVVISRSGGTTATIKSLRNEITGAILYINYGMLDGETITINLRPSAHSVVSSYFGSVLGASLPNSDIADFYLMPGNGSGAQDNLITCFVDGFGSPTITAVMRWRDCYQSYD